MSLLTPHDNSRRIVETSLLRFAPVATDAGNLGTADETVRTDVKSARTKLPRAKFKERNGKQGNLGVCSCDPESP